MEDRDVEVIDLSYLDADDETPPWENGYRYILKPQFAKFAKEHIWSDEIWDLFVRYRASDIKFHDMDEEDLLKEACYLDFENESTLRRLKANAEWEPNIPTDDTVIRRYITFDRFIDLIDNSGFWMSNISQFPDQFEAAFPDPSVNMTQRFVDSAANLSPNQDQVTYGVKNRRKRDKHTYVNCWRVGEGESSVFWDAYLGDEDGLAIQTTVRDLREHIHGEVWDGYIDHLISSETDSALKQFSKILIGEVEYLDYDAEPISNSLMSPARFFHKRHAFGDEQEFRLVTSPPPLSSTQNLPEPDDGYILKADVVSLINKVIVSPNSSDDFCKIADNAIRDGLGIPVVESSLSRDPNNVDLPNY